MAAVGVASGVGVVLEQVDVATDALVGQPLFGVDQKVLQHALTCAVMGDELNEAVTLGRRVLRVRPPHVEVETGAVAEEHVGASAPRDHAPEEVAGNFVGRQPSVTVKRARHTEFGLNAHDSPLHVVELTGCACQAW